MSPLKLLPILTPLLLTSCETAEDRAQAYVGVPIAYWDPAEQKKADKLIEARCGRPPVCPADAVLERATLELVKLRNLVRSAGGKDVKP